MRLICPNCAAQYEVDEGVIPTDGRDVQCSNCGHAWFQPGTYGGAAESPDLTDAPMADEPGEVPEEETADILESEGLSPTPVSHDEPASPADSDDTAAQAYEVSERDDDDGAQEADGRTDTDDPEINPSEETLPEPLAASLPARQELDDSVLSILKEEAERETEARRAEGTSLEMQPDLGLAAAIGAMVKDDAAAVDDTASDRAASQRDGPAEEGDDATLNRGPRRGLLPDIEEINSTLSAKRGRTATEDVSGSSEALVLERRRSGFRRGFSLALLLTVLLLALYALAPAISTRVPALASVLDRYVAAVNDGRLWLDEMMKSSTEALRQDDAQGG
jgi:predicted Zn finger-like uncharacterized protein